MSLRTIESGANGPASEQDCACPDSELLTVLVTLAELSDEVRAGNQAVMLSQDK